MSNAYRFTRPSPSLRRAKLDNVALVPASLLPFKSQWQAIANGLARDGVLILLPSGPRPPRKTLETIASLLKTGGHKVKTIPTERFAGA